LSYGLLQGLRRRGEALRFVRGV